MNSFNPLLLGAIGGALGAVLGSVVTAAVMSASSPTPRTAVAPAPVELDMPVSRPVSRPVSQDEVVAVPAPSPPLMKLEQALQDAAAERSQLAAAQLELARDLDALGLTVGALNLPGGGSGEATDGSQLTDPEAAPFDQGRGFGRRGDGLSSERLVAAGIDVDTATALAQRSDAWQLERLQLIDRASREGWGESEELDAQLDSLDETRPDLREELGEAAYDRYLYEGGQPNRIGVASVIPGSAAALGGVEPGDLVLAYAGERVFRIGELQSATRGGTLGESLAVLIERDGQSLTVQLPRGPLGVSLAPRREEP